MNNQILTFLLAIENDKLLHALVGLSAGILGYAIGSVITKKIWKQAGIALFFGSMAGFGKEFLDSRDGGSGFDWVDLAYTLAGVILGALLFYKLLKK